MCKIARFREFVRLHGQFHAGARVFPVCAVVANAAPWPHSTRVRIVERVAEVVTVMPRPASAQTSQDVRY